MRSLAEQLHGIAKWCWNPWVPETIGVHERLALCGASWSLPQLRWPQGNQLRAGLEVYRLAGTKREDGDVASLSIVKLGQTGDAPTAFILSCGNRCCGRLRIDSCLTADARTSQNWVSRIALPI